jgi:hypothetical protein
VVDVSDVAGELAKAEGGFYDIYPPADVVGGKWMALPHSIVGNAVSFRDRSATRTFPVGVGAPAARLGPRERRHRDASRVVR